MSDEKVEWKRLDELLRDPEVEGQRFISKADHEAALARVEAELDSQAHDVENALIERDEAEQAEVRFQERADHYASLYEETRDEIERLRWWLSKAESRLELVREWAGSILEVDDHHSRSAARMVLSLLDKKEGTNGE